MTHRPLYTIPIKDRPPHGPWMSKILFPLLFTLAQLGINSAQFLLLPLLLVPFAGRQLFESAIGWTKDGYGRLIERDTNGAMTKLNLPDRLVVMSNHQAYLDWMYVWIIACYAGHSSGLIILLKASLKRIPVVGWGMQFFNFIFLKRSWAADRNNLTLALTQLGQKAQSDEEADGSSENTSLLSPKKRSPLWLVIFPEGTITSDDERAKSVKYAKREETVPDLQLLDLTIGYPGVPYGKYPQDWPLSIGEPTSPQSGLATPEESRAFELWLRSVWTAKEKRMEGFYRHQSFDEGTTEVVPVKQL
ncbi:hypothetical protein CI109_100358 [Kwoniella shandongensis]|uniref:Phospholipid/glycerol acyltransferase domain-containing protein n=1 Tax=Kwoniella shandongensis TaxID=1734106 RepID=A0AAJ8LDP5_9TREE